MNVDEKFISQIVEEVFNRLSKKECELPSDVLNVDYLTLKECACIIHDVSCNEKIAEIINANSVIVNKVESGVLTPIYKKLLAEKGITFGSCKPLVSNDFSDTFKITKALINEKDIACLDSQYKKVLISKRSVLTPLAKDMIRSKNLLLVEE